MATADFVGRKERMWHSTESSRALILSSVGIDRPDDDIPAGEASTKAKLLNTRALALALALAIRGAFS